MRRWILWILIVLLVLIVGTLIAVQIVLATDLPRRLALDALQEQTGLRFTASSLDTGWRGRTELRDLTVALPFETQPFLFVPSMRISHTDLLRLVLFRDIEIDAAEVDRPRVVLEQDSHGVWNLARAAAIFEQTQAARDEPPARGDALPRLNLREAMLEVKPRGMDAVTYGPISMDGRQETALVWSFTVDLDQQTIAQGRLAPGGAWAHEVAFTFEAVRPLLEPWLARIPAAPDPADVPDDIQLAGSWQGQIDNGALAGRLRLDRIVADDMSLEGSTAISVTADGLVIEPANLIVRTGEAAIDPVRIVGGRIHAAAGEVRLERVFVEAMNVAARIDGWWSEAREGGEATVRWRGEVAEWHALHEGAIRASFTTPPPHPPGVGRRSLAATIEFRGSAPQGEWETEFELTASGHAWDSLAGALTAQRLALYGAHESLDLSGFAARVRRDGQLIRLTHLNLPEAHARGEGHFDLETLTWSLDLDARQWLLPATLAGAYLDDARHIGAVHLRVQAVGDPRRVVLDRFRLANADAVLSAAGEYRLKTPDPIDARVSLVTNIPVAGLMPDGPFRGRAAANFTVRGTAEPLRLHVDGLLLLDDVTLGERALEDVSVPLNGLVHADAATLASEEFALLGGTWRLAGHVDRARGNVMLSLDGRDAVIERLVDLLGVPIELAGEADATVDVFVPHFDLARMELEGSWTIERLRGEWLAGEHASGRGGVRAFGDRFELHDVILEHAGGEIVGAAHLSLDQPERITLDMRASDWPVRLGAANHLLLRGAARLEVDAAGTLAFGDINAGGEILLDGRDAGAFSLNAAIDGRELDLHAFDLTLLGGAASGRGRFNLTRDEWPTSEAEVTWSDLDLSLVQALVPGLAGADELAGLASGSITLQRADERRAPEPMRLEGSTRVEGGRFGEIDFSDFDLIGHVGPDRFMIQRLNAAVADGQVGVWGRLTRHTIRENDAELFAHVFLTFDRLDLQQIVLQSGYAKEPTPGRLSGRLSAGGYLREPHRMFGQGAVELAESDLGAAPGFALVYDLLRIDFRAPQPTGRGEVTLRLENDALEMTRIAYFNRGTDVIGRLRVENIWEGRDSPIDGLFGGVVRPLRDLDLPFIGRLDDLLGAIQANAVSVRVGGTLGDPEQSVAPLAEVFGTLQRILRGVQE